MTKFGIRNLFTLVAVGVISLPLLASSTSAVAASPRTTPPIGTQLAELKGSDTVAGDFFGYSVAFSGTTAVGSWVQMPAGCTCSPRRRPGGSRPPS